MLQINIQQTFGMIGLRYQPLQWQISSQPADLQVTQTNPQVNIDHSRSDLQIDQTEAFADEGRRTPLAFITNEAESAKSALANGIVDRVSFGDALMKSKDPIQTVKQHEVDESMSPKQVQPTLVPQPFSVQIHYTPSDIHFHTTLGQLHIQATVHQPRITEFVPGKVTTYVERAPSISVTATPSGQTFDEKV